MSAYKPLGKLKNYYTSMNSSTYIPSSGLSSGLSSDLAIFLGQQVPEAKEENKPVTFVIKEPSDFQEAPHCA